jgi:hypothetical protein
MLPVLNHPELPPGASNGVAIQDCDFVIMQINPYAPRYIWTESYTNYYFHCWDVQADTARAFPGGDQNMRVFVVDKQGNLWTSISGTAMRRNFAGAAKIVGRNLSTNMPSAYVYTHSYDSAFTTNRGTGNIELYDFVNDTVIPIADLPGDQTSNVAYRAITISRDDKKLFVLGHSGTIYELTIATRQYKTLGTISTAGSYAFSSGTMDTLGNWYICTWGGGRTYWVQVHMGKDTLSALPIPDDTEIEEYRASQSFLASPMQVFPNPVRSAAEIRLAKEYAGVVISVLDQRGRIVERMDARGSRATWNAAWLPSGVYVLRAQGSRGVLAKKVVLMR